MEKERLDGLKKACIVLNAIAENFKDEQTKLETKSLAWCVSHAVVEIARLEADNAALLEALIGVIRVADRKTVEFDAARAAITQAEGK